MTNQQDRALVAQAVAMASAEKHKTWQAARASAARHERALRKQAREQRS